MKQRFTSLALILSFTFFTHKEVIEIYAFSNGQKFGEKYLNQQLLYLQARILKDFCLYTRKGYSTVQEF